MSTEATESSAVICDKNNTILQNEFLLQCGKHSFTVFVSLTRDKLVYRGHNAAKIKGQEIPFSDVIGCRCLCAGGDADVQHAEESTATAASRSNSHKAKMKSKLADNAACLQVYAYPYNKKAEDGGIRCRVELNFIAAQLETKGENAVLVQRWRLAILAILHGVQFSNIDELDASKLPPPPHYMVCINPFSGKGKAGHIFKHQVAPVFREANISFKAVITERKGHGMELAKRLDLKEYNGIIIVSGDGLLYEFINGFKERDDKEEAFKIPFGIIPGGSGNALCVAVLSHKGEQFKKNMAVHAAVRIIKGCPEAKDLVSIQTHDAHIFSFLSIAWGIIADIDIESEIFRFLGDTRFTVGAVNRILSLRKYPGRLAFLPVDDDSKYDYLFQKDDHTTRSTSKRKKAHQHNDAIVANWNANTAASGSKAETSEDMKAEDDSQGTDANCQQVEGIGDEQSNWNTSSDTELELPPLTEPVPSSWTVIEGDFIGVLVAYISHVSGDFIAHPHRPFDERVISVQYMDTSLSRSDLVNALSNLKTGEYLKEGKIKTKMVKAFRLEPLNEKGILTVDGEQVKYGPVQGCVSSLKCLCFM